MRALIDPNAGGWIVKLARPGEDYPAVEPLFWADCDEAARQDTHRWNGTAVVLRPPRAADPVPPPGNGAGVKAQRARALDALAASDPSKAVVVDVLKVAGLI